MDDHRWDCLQNECGFPLEILDIPAARSGNQPNLYQCEKCGNVYRDLGERLEIVTHLFKRLGAGDDRVQMAMSDGHEIHDESVMELIIKWRAASEMETLALIGQIQQRLGVLDNRLHSLKRRLAQSLLGEPVPMDTDEMLRLVDECIDLASPAPARERGIKQTRG